MSDIERRLTKRKKCNNYFVVQVGITHCHLLKKKSDVNVTTDSDFGQTELVLELKSS